MHLKKHDGSPIIDCVEKNTERFVMNLVDAGKMNDEQAREYLEKVYWPNGAFCPHCKCLEVCKLEGEKHRPGLYQCNGCRQQFTVTVGTVMEDTHIPLSKWIMGFHLMCSSKKGISALQLQRNLGLGSYRTAWHMAHRIRHAMDTTGGLPVMSGNVEADETYVGGKPRYKYIPGGKFPRAKPGRGTSKTPVVALVERETGKVRAKPVDHVTIKNLKEHMQQHMLPEATLHTDEFPAYREVGKDFAGHDAVTHSRGEFARGAAHCNSAESFFALLKRGVHGIFHHVSKKHLHRYCNEFGFRWEHKNVDDGVRTERAIQAGEGKRLQYRSVG